MKPWFRPFKRAVELWSTGSNVHTSSTDTCVDSALISFSSSSSFDPAANSVARAFTSCTVSERSLLESVSALGAGAAFLFFFFRICSVAGTQSSSFQRGSDCSVSPLSGAIFRFFDSARLPVLAFFLSFLAPEPWAFVGGASGFGRFPFGARSSFRAD